MKTRPFLLHALSPLHAGTGHAADIIDLPTARMKATGIPFVPGSSIKGVLRDARRGDGEGKVQATFGPETEEAAHAGALIVGDARLLALPVRSFRGTFAWVTSPLLLLLAERDLEAKLPIPSFAGRGARIPSSCLCEHRGRIYLEDLDLEMQSWSGLDQWSRALASRVSPGTDIFSKRFLVVDDDTMSFLFETATQVDARVRISNDTRTVAPGALWLEESLPAETLLLGLLAADRSRRQGVAMTPEEVLDFALADDEVVQLGGKATVGRGRCRMIPLHNRS